ncbi:MAG: hypothetical protein DME97_17700 [Verrucomicrobia bacterium]|nr:MAG: hypothetical protein DME97_17700 [Verrucomicrobiota bacterium]
MQIFFVPSEKMSLHDENVALKTTNSELTAAIANRDQRIRELTVPEVQALGWNEIEDGYAMRAGRDAEQRDFLRRYVDKEVDWEITLRSQFSPGDWSFSYKKDGSRLDSAALFAARFVEGSPASSLKSGDRIKVHGKLTMFGSERLQIEAATYEFLSPAGSK